MLQPRIYIRFPGARLWCVLVSARFGHSITSYCNGRAHQSDTEVHIATDAPEELRCTACELAADDAERGAP